LASYDVWNVHALRYTNINTHLQIWRFPKIVSQLWKL